MELKTHDLLKIKDIDEFLKDLQQNNWINEAIRRAPFVVVRRSILTSSLIPVGIRGFERSQRFAASLSYNNISDKISPEQISKSKLWETNEHIKNTKIYNVLQSIDYILEQEGLSWGPTGSTGFELVSDMSTVNKNSDLDIIIRAKKTLDLNTAIRIKEKLDEIPFVIDSLIETPEGSISLIEYSKNIYPILLRTVNGPYLVNDPWIKASSIK